MITIFTDGSSRGNPGPGGWGAVIAMEKEVGSMEYGKTQIIELGGGEKNTTNNRMELMAVIQGLRKGAGDSNIQVYTDSSYVINGITKWIKGWKRNGWKTKTKDDVLNKDLWMELDESVNEIQSAGGKIIWEYVGGHVGIVGNERCDHIATAFADGRKIELYKGPLAGYDLPNILDVSLDEAKLKAKKSDGNRSNAKAYSYVSSVGGIIEVHNSWAECEKRVKGARGARYKKALNLAEEGHIIDEFGML